MSRNLDLSILLGLMIGSGLSIATDCFYHNTLIVEYSITASLAVRYALPDRTPHKLRSLLLCLLSCIIFSQIPNPFFSKPRLSQDIAPIPTWTVFRKIGISKIDHHYVTARKIPGIFANQDLSKHTTPEESTFGRARLFQLADRLKEHITKSIGVKSDKLIPWYKAILLGEKGSLTHQNADNFKVLGIYHIVVISGLHLNLFANASRVAFCLPGRFLYAIRLMNPIIFVAYESCVSFLALAMVAIYAICVEIEPPVQRSFLMLAVGLGGKIFLGTRPVRDRIIAGLALQASLFPLGFLCPANILSWYAYMVLVLRPSRRCESGFLKYWRIFLQSLHTQILLTLIVGSIFGKMSIAGIFVNLIISPFILPLLSSSFLIFVPGLSPTMIKFVDSAHLHFLSLSNLLARKLEGYSLACIDLRPFWSLRIALSTYCLACLLKDFLTNPKNEETGTFELLKRDM